MAQENCVVLYGSLTSINELKVCALCWTDRTTQLAQDNLNEGI